MRAAVRFCGPVAGALKDQLNDAEKVKVLVKSVSTYGLSRASIGAVVQDNDVLMLWVLPLIPAVFAGGWEVCARISQGDEPPPVPDTSPPPFPLPSNGKTPP